METWSKEAEEQMYKIRVAQRVMERVLLALHLVDHDPKLNIRRCTIIKDSVIYNAKQKLQRAGHLINEMPIDRLR